MSVIPLLDAVTPLVTKFLSYIPNGTQRAEAEKEIRESLQTLDKQQTDIDAVEAASPNLFISGARPFILWTCGLIFAYNFLIQPLLIFLIMYSGSDFDPHTLPVFNYGDMMPVLMGMLGLSSLRTYDKIKGVA